MMSKQWYEDLPAVYRADLDTLQFGLGYFKYTEVLPFETTNKQLIVYGEVLYGENKKQLVRIAFPHAYPYSPIEIFPVRKVQTHQGIADVAILFQRGNQYNNGKMCLFDEDEEWIPFTTGINVAISQSVKWLESATSGKGFTKDMVVEENPSIVEHKGQLLYYLPAEMPKAKKGTLLLKSFKENYYSLVQVQFETISGTTIIDSFPDGNVLAPTRDNLIFGKWFYLDGDPKKILPSLINPEGFKLCINHTLKTNLEDLLPNPSAEVKRTVIGFIIGEVKQIHCFQIYYWKEGVQVKFQPSYLLPKNLTQELFIRIHSLFDLEILEKKRVLIVGLGAIGSEVAKELSSCSIGNYTLIDKEPFEAGNSLRHAADLQYIGEYKAEVGKKIIQARNPKAKVNAVPANLLDIPQDIIDAILDETDIVVDATANKLVESYLNQKVFIERGLPLVQAAVSKGGLTGLVLALVPKKSACLECLKINRLVNLPTPLISLDELKETPPDYGICSRPALPASGLDTREISIQTARIVLQILFDNEKTFYPKLGGYQFYWHGPGGSKGNGDLKVHKPFEWEVNNFKTTAPCEICNKKNDKEYFNSSDSKKEPHRRSIKS